MNGWSWRTSTARIGFVHAEHFHKAVALGAVGAAVVNDLDVADSADALEELLEVLLGHVVGQVADVNAGGFDAFRVATTRAVVIARGAFLALALAFRAGFAGWTRLTGFARRTGFAFAGAGVAGVGLGCALTAWERRGFDFFLGVAARCGTVARAPCRDRRP